MERKFTVPLTKIIGEFSLEQLYIPENIEDVKVAATEINRPGLQLAGFFDFFDSEIYP